MKILVIIDMQNDFLTGSLANHDANQLIKNVCDKIKSDTWDKIYVTRDTHMSDYLETSEGQKLPIHCIENTEGWLINKEVFDTLSQFKEENCNDNVYYVDKNSFGSFVLSAEIENDLLSQSFVDENETYKMISKDNKIVLCGSCADTNIISNALILKASSTIREYSEIYCSKSCCSSISEEKCRNAIDIMESCQIKVTQ